ncbi:hypothetical protein [Geodermatophilus sp. SYSU D01105]
MSSTPTRATRLAAATGGVLLSALVSACAGQHAADDSNAPPASASTAPTSTAPTNTAPTSTAPTSTAPTGSVPATTAPTPAVPVDWRPLAFDAADCVSREEWRSDHGDTATWDDTPLETHEADVTGDGRPEVFVTSTCPAPTSNRAAWVVAFQDTAGVPTALGVLTGDALLERPEVTTDGATVTLEGVTVAGEDAYCCGEHWARAVYRWTDGRFVLAERLEALTSQPFSPTGLADGSHVGVIRGGDDDTVLVDLVEWFEGPAAEQACREDGVQVHEQMAWCSDYYVRNHNDLVRVLPTVEDVPITHIGWPSGEDRTDRLSAVADLVVSDSRTTERFFEFTVEDGVVTAFTGEHFVS